ncbi:hypothetical protein JSQ81_15510 [Sporosarcina sp. Marseille-Q4063]|uniref:hypothetical protein n=1 Tax=Sporosarcina sp. Marseille-Q4063 TaxID=2810514 RepID=UPI001BAEFD01|nr:hypothetical protein [Sporosarcina sp. Marseille-Q4063]QUW21202.1 hypothetical protein JSQ81_15510 [Sporosarcina sp. Marseille-Q4063]
MKKELRRNRRRRYKKKEKHGLFLAIKLALICYLAIFGISYMTSNTSAYYSSQASISEIITADTWEDPDENNQCGEENEEATASGDEINADCVDKDEPKVEEEKVTDQENSEPGESEDKSDETDIEKEDKVDSDAGKEKENQNPKEDTQKQPDKEDESVDESNEKKPDDKAPVEKAPEDSSDDELNTTVTKEDNTKKVEGDTNEQEEGSVE